MLVEIFVIDALVVSLYNLARTIKCGVVVDCFGGKINVRSSELGTPVQPRYSSSCSGADCDAGWFYGTPCRDDIHR